MEMAEMFDVVGGMAADDYRGTSVKRRRGMWSGAK
jgi:hypothetical protein